MLRSLIVILAIILFFLFSLPLFAVEWVIGKFSPRARDISLLRIAQWFCRILLFLSGVHITLIGKEHIPTDRSALYVINHRSFFDILLTLPNCPRTTGYIGKKEIAKVPVLGWWLKALHGYFLDRQDVKQALKTILSGIEDLKSGISIAVFPEGTRGRSRDERQMLDFHEGTFKLALKSGAPIVPVTIAGSSAILEDHFPLIRASRVIVEYGTPIDTALLSREERKFTGRTVQAIMKATLEKNHQLLDSQR